MKRNVLVFMVFLFFGVQFVTAKESKKIPNEEAKKWHNDLHASPYKVYENFDGTVLHYDSISNLIAEKKHIKFYMGCSGSDEMSAEYRLFLVPVTGEEAEKEYVNDYGDIRFYNGKNWEHCSKEMLQSWAGNWTKQTKSKQLSYTKAFLVPNEDVLEFKKGAIYLTFGQDKKDKENQIKLLLSNENYKPAKSNDKLAVVGDGDVVYMDCCMPCPKVCASNELDE